MPPSVASRPRAESLHVVVLDADSGFVLPLGSRIERAGGSWRALAAGPLSGGDLVAARAHALVADLDLLGGPDGIADVGAAVPGLGLLVCGPAGTPVAARVAALRAGADDWIAKPCHAEEVLARIEAVVRRRRWGRLADEEGPLRAGELEIRSDLFQAFAAGRDLELTRREFELLALLAAAEGRVLAREEVYERVWGYAMARGDRSVDVFVRRLRGKLRARSPRWRYIHTHVGVGYRFAAEPDPGEADPCG